MNKILITSALLVLALIVRHSVAYTLEPWEKRWAMFEERLTLCTNQQGYDTAKSDALGDYELGQGELEWRECAYEGLMDVMATGSPAQDAYQRLIFEDKRLTRAILARQLTRAQRRDRILTYLDQIHDAEKKEHDLRTLERERDVFMNRMDEIQRMRSIERMMR